MFALVFFCESLIWFCENETKLNFVYLCENEKQISLKNSNIFFFARNILFVILILKLCESTFFKTKKYLGPGPWSDPYKNVKWNPDPNEDFSVQLL